MLGRILGVALVAVLILGIAGTAYWGSQEQADKNTILIQAENNYQRAFHELTNNMSNLEDELGKSLAMNSPDLIAPCMTNIWRIAYQTHSNIGQLPLSLTPFQKAEQFLGQIADYTYDIGMRNLDEQSIDDQEWKTLQQLHTQAEEIQQDLRRLQTKVLNDDLRWMDVELAVAAQDKDMDKTIMNGVEELDKRVQGYIETEGGPFQNKVGDEFTDKRDQIDGEEIDADQAQQNALDFFDIKEKNSAEVEENGQSREFTAYRVSIDDEENNQVTIDVSQKGGHVIWMLNSRDIEESSIGLNEAQSTALQFLQDHDLGEFTVVESDQYDNVGVFDFVPIKDDIRSYPELIRCKVALDNGELIGYDALDYVVNHDQEFDTEEPSVTMDEAKNSVNGHFNVQEEHLSLVEIKAGEVKLCYELLGTVENETYRLFINAQTGKEERVEKMKKAQPII